MIRISAFFTAQVALAEPLRVHVIDSGGAAIAGVAVYLIGDDRGLSTHREPSAVAIEQKHKAFSPYLSIASTGDTVSFSNLDDITHHIYSVAGPKKFSFNIRAGATEPDMSLERTGIIAMGCNIHDWMSGYMLIVDSGLFAMTDANGLAVIDVDVDASLNVVAWHPQFNEVLQQTIAFPELKSVSLQLEREMDAVPRQRSVDDFDFLDGY